MHWISELSAISTAAVPVVIIPAFSLLGLAFYDRIAGMARRSRVPA